MAAPEMTAIRASFEPLVDGLTGQDIGNIADDLYANNIISTEVYKELFFPNKNRKQKARDIVNIVTGEVNVNSESFVKFIKVLKDNELPELAEHLEGKFGECTKELIDIIKSDA